MVLIAPLYPRSSAARSARGRSDGVRLGMESRHQVMEPDCQGQSHSIRSPRNPATVDHAAVKFARICDPVTKERRAKRDEHMELRHVLAEVQMY